MLKKEDCTPFDLDYFQGWYKPADYLSRWRVCFEKCKQMLLQGTDAVIVERSLWNELYYWVESTTDADANPLSWAIHNLRMVDSRPEDAIARAWEGANARAQMASTTMRELHRRLQATSAEFLKGVPDMLADHVWELLHENGIVGENFHKVPTNEE